VKNLFAIAFSCVYLTLTVGVAKTTHYCMGRENHTTFFSYYTDPCICSVLAGNLSSCCSNESVLLKVDSDQSISLTVEIAPVQLPLLEVIYYSTVKPSIGSKISNFFPEKYLRPPPLKAYVMNCSFVFYDEEDPAKSVS